MAIVIKDHKPRKKIVKTHEKIVKILKRKQKLKEKKNKDKQLSKPKEKPKQAKVSDAPLSAEESALKLMGMPFTVTQSEVRKWFQDDGIRVEEVHMCGGERKTGMAYVTMETDLSLKKGLKKDKQYMGERYVNVVLKTKKEMKQVLRLAAMLDTSVFLRGLPFEIYALDILRFFKGLKIAENGIHLRNKGFAIVEFVDSETAKEALKRDKEYIRERYVKVFPCKMKDLVEMRDQILDAKRRKRNFTKQDEKKERTSSESMETEEMVTAENTENASSKEESDKEEEEVPSMEVESPKDSDPQVEEDSKGTEEAESESGEDEGKDNEKQEESENGSDEQQSESDAQDEPEEESIKKKPKGKKKTVVDVVMDKISPRRLRSKSGTPSKAQTPQVKRLQTPRTPRAAGTPKTPRATGTPKTPRANGTPRTPRASARRGKKE